MSFPVLPDPENEWATVIRGRHPIFKIHHTLGHAKAAITTSRVLSRYYVHYTYSAGLYRRTDGNWVRVLYRESREYTNEELAALRQQLKDLKA